MNSVAAVIAAAMIIFVVWRIRNRAKRKVPRAPLYQPQVDGDQVTVFLHPRMSSACLFDHGLQYGRGFRRKEGPVLPHDANCRCRTIHFSFSSSDVFNGALRRVGSIESTVPGLDAEGGRKLIEALKRAESKGVPGSLEEYLGAVGPEAIAPALREELHAFLAQRYDFLKSRPQGAAEADDQAREAADSP
ncbi:MAG: hypothetical protein HY423_01095 [Candidatus Lambdaproteobacteria bacterium]|nr:hypothetical protein [Candidatus Lambdaproteobacteria bacterium]